MRKRNQHSIRLTTLVRPEVADAYRDMAAVSGKSVSQVMREALEDHVAATRAETDIIKHMKEDNFHEASTAYFQLAKGMMDEAMKSMIEVAVLNMDAIGMQVHNTKAPAAVQSSAMAVQIIAIDQSKVHDVPGAVAVYDVKALVDNQPYSFRVSISQSVMDSQIVHIASFCDNQYESVFKRHSWFLTDIYMLVLDVFHQREVVIPALLDESTSITT